MLVIGSVLTRRAVERATLKDVSHQTDLLAEREKLSIVPLARLKQFQPVLHRQHELTRSPRLNRPTPFLTGEQRAELLARRKVEGTQRFNGTTYFFSARRVKNRALILLRPKRLG